MRCESDAPDGFRIKSWECRNKLHAQPCWHARAFCTCGKTHDTAFDFTEQDAREIVEIARNECIEARKGDSRNG